MSSYVSRRICRSCAAHAGRAIDRLPRWIFNWWGLDCIDGSLSMVAIWLAWQLRFDFDVPAELPGSRADIRSRALAGAAGVFVERWAHIEPSGGTSTLATP